MTERRAPELGFIHRFDPGAGGRGDLTLLLLHGTGGDENDLLPIGRALSPDAALLSPRGQVLERGMPRFFRRIAEGVFDEADLIARTHELAEFIRRATAHYGVNPLGVVAVGYSNGANIAASTLLLHPGVLHGAILFRPMVPFEPRTVPQLPGTPVLISAGRLDPIIPAANTERLAELLRTAGAAVTMHVEPAGHELREAELAVAREWLGEAAESRKQGAGPRRA